MEVGCPVGDREAIEGNVPLSAVLTAIFDLLSRSDVNREKAGERHQGFEAEHSHK